MTTSAELLAMLNSNKTVATKPLPKTVNQVCSDGGEQKHDIRGIQIFVATLDYPIKDWRGLNNISKACGGTYAPKGYIKSAVDKTGFWFATKQGLDAFLMYSAKVDWEIKPDRAEAERVAEENRFAKFTGLVDKVKTMDELQRMQVYLNSVISAHDSKSPDKQVVLPPKKTTTSFVLKPTINKQYPISTTDLP